MVVEDIYNKCRNVHQAAVFIVKRRGSTTYTGQMPGMPKDIRKMFVFSFEILDDFLVKVELC